METERLSSPTHRIFLKISSILAEPLCRTYGTLRYRLMAPLSPNIFHHYDTTLKELGYRLLLGISAFAICAAFPMQTLGGAALLGLSSKFFRAIGFYLQDQSYTHVCGQAKEEALGNELKLMTWNVCGIGGGLSYDHGGVVDWQSRLAGLVEKISKENPDVLLLQEIYDGTLAELLIDRLKDRYAHFFCHLGASVMGSVGGLMVISKFPVYRFENENFSTNDWTLQRGFATLEIGNTEDSLPKIRIIGTHLIHGDSPTQISARASQIEQIAKSIKGAVLTILMGDFNIERDSDEGKHLLRYFDHAYLGNDPTCTNRMMQQWDLEKKNVWAETIDNISILKNSSSPKVLECHLSQAFDDSFDTKTALSDHHAVVASLKMDIG